jgi:hypothetical protein
MTTLSGIEKKLPFLKMAEETSYSIDLIQGPDLNRDAEDDLKQVSCDGVQHSTTSPPKVLEAANSLLVCNGGLAL